MVIMSKTGRFLTNAACIAVLCSIACAMAFAQSDPITITLAGQSMIRSDIRATSPAAGPEVSSATFAAAEKLLQLRMSEKDLKQAASSWRVAMAPLYERRTGPKKLNLEETIAPASRWIRTAASILPGPPARARLTAFR